MDAKASTANSNGNGRTRRASTAYEEVLERIKKREEGDPARKVPGAPPNFGKDVFPHVLTFQGILSSIARVYRPSDEALRDSYSNARFMRNDCSIMECLEQRKRSTALLDWHLEPENAKDVAGQWVADQMTAILNRIPRFMQYRECLLDALWYGRAAARHRYEWQIVNKRQRVCIADWKPIHGDKMVFRYDDGTGRDTAENVGIRVGAGYAAQHPALKKWADPAKGEKIKPTDWGLAYFLDPWEREMIAIHKHQIEDGEYEDPENAGRIHGVGIRSRIYWCWYQKQEALAWLMEYLERSGFGIEIWYYPYGNAEAKQKTREAAEERIGQGRNIILVPRPVGDQAMAYGVERIEPGMAGAGMLQDILSNYFGHQIKRYILGQTLTTEASNTGLGSNLGEIHMATYLDIIKYDAINLQETLTSELVEPLKAYNFPAYRDVKVHFRIETETENVEKKLEAWRQAFDMGVKLRARDVYETIGAIEPGPDDETLQSPQYAQQQIADIGMTGLDETVPTAQSPTTQAPQVGEIRRIGSNSYRFNTSHRWANYSKSGQREMLEQADLGLSDDEAKYLRQFEQGRQVEMEHTDDPAVADKIARDHLAEDAAYYDKLEEIEKYARQMGLFDEEEHPRDEDGKFAEKAGAGEKKDTPPPKRKQGTLFQTRGLPGQMNAFEGIGVPDEMIAKGETPKETEEGIRVLQPHNKVARGMGLTDDDFSKASRLIPDSVLRGSGQEDGWVYGIKEWRKGKSEPGDPNFGGGIASSSIQGFKAAKEANIEQDLYVKPEVHITKTAAQLRDERKESAAKPEEARAAKEPAKAESAGPEAPYEERPLEDPQKRRPSSLVNELIYWDNIDGSRHAGVVVDSDSNDLIVRVRGNDEQAVAVDAVTPLGVRSEYVSDALLHALTTTPEEWVEKTHHDIDAPHRVLAKQEAKRLHANVLMQAVLNGAQLPDFLLEHYPHLDMAEMKTLAEKLGDATEKAAAQKHALKKARAERKKELEEWLKGDQHARNKHDSAAYRMTLPEYLRTRGLPESQVRKVMHATPTARGRRNDPETGSTVSVAESWYVPHFEAVKRAVSEGKRVAKDVLADYPDVQPAKAESAATEAAVEKKWALQSVDDDVQPEWFNGKAFPGTHSNWKAIVTKDGDMWLISSKRKDGKATGPRIWAETREEAFRAIQSLGGWWKPGDDAFRKIVADSRKKADLTSKRSDIPIKDMTFDQFMEHSRFTTSGKDSYLYDPSGQRWLNVGTKSKRAAAEHLYKILTKKADVPKEPAP